jgi:hypothetical protein
VLWWCLCWTVAEFCGFVCHLLTILERRFGKASCYRCLRVRCKPFSRWCAWSCSIVSAVLFFLTWNITCLLYFWIWEHMLFVPQKAFQNVTTKNWRVYIDIIYMHAKFCGKLTFFCLCHVEKYKEMSFKKRFKHQNLFFCTRHKNIGFLQTTSRAHIIASCTSPFFVQTFKILNYV